MADKGIIQHEEVIIFTLIFCNASKYKFEMKYIAIGIESDEKP